MHKTQNKKTINKKSHMRSKRGHKKGQTGGFDLTQEQKQVIFRSTEKCLSQKGIILYHYMGSGKTLSSLHILFHKNFKNNEKLLFCDENVKNNAWLKDAEKFENHYSTEIFMSASSLSFRSNNNDNQTSPSRCKKTDIINNIYHPYDHFFSRDIEFANKIIIVDEAHNISKRIRDLTNRQEINIDEFIKKISTCRKIILLTGTPIYEDLTDLIILINMAAGDGKYISYQKDIFLNTFVLLNPTVKFLYTHMIPVITLILQSTKTVINAYNPLSITLLLQSLFFIFTKSKNSQTQSFISKNLNNKKLLLGQLTLYFFLHISKKLNNQNILSLSKIRFNQRNIQKYISPYIDYYKPDVLPTKIFEIKYVPYNFYQVFEWYQIYMGIFSKPDILKENKQDDPSNINFFSFTLQDKFENEGRSIGNIIYHEKSFVKEFTKKAINRSVDLFGTVNSMYSKFFQTIINSLRPFISKQRVEQLEDNDPYANADKQIKKQFLNDQINQYNKTIPHLQDKYTKIETNTSSITDLSANTMAELMQTMPYFFDTIPYKFKELFNYLNENQGNHLIYSNFFENGGNILYHYLSDEGIDVKLYNKAEKSTHSHIEWFSSNDNNNKVKVKVLILSPDSSEGISINNTHYFHILDPILEFSKREQVIGRAVRMNSHNNMSSDNKKVTIIDWICKLDTSNTFSKYFYEGIKNAIFVSNFSNTVFPNKFFEDAQFPFYTPDEIVFKKNNNLSIFQDALEKSLANDNIKPCAEAVIKDYCYTLDKDM